MLGYGTVQPMTALEVMVYEICYIALAGSTLSSFSATQRAVRPGSDHAVNTYTSRSARRRSSKAREASATLASIAVAPRNRRAHSTADQLSSGTGVDLRRTK